MGIHRFARMTVMCVLTLAGIPATPASGVVEPWTTHGPWGGQINAAVELPGPSAVILVATGAGIARSTDAGSSWQDSSSGLTTRYESGIALCTNGDVLTISGVSDVYRSSDSGRSWSSLGLAGTAFQAVAVDPISRASYYVGSNSSVFRTTNGGSTWSASLVGAAINALAATGAGHLVAGTVNGTFRSTDGGGSWTPSNTGLTGPGVYSVVTDAANAAIVYAGTDSGLFRSGDEGATWSPCAAPPGAYAPVALAARGDNVWATRNGFLFRSSDSGATWTSIQGTIGEDTRCLAILASDPSRLLVGGVARGVWRSEDGGSTWLFSSEGLAARDAVVLSASSETGRVVAGTGWISRSGDGGLSWTDANVSFVYDIGEARDGTLLATPTGGIARSTDDGVSWWPIGPQTNPTITELAFDPADSLRIYGAQWTNVATSTDGGATWPVTSGPDAYVTALIASRTAGGHLWAGTIDGVRRSTDGGDSFAPASTGLTDPVIFKLAIDAQGRLLAGTSNGNVFRSEDGTSWTERNAAPLSEHGIRALSAHPRRPEWAFAGTDDGVKLSTDGGLTWSSFGLAGRNVASLAFGANATQLHAGLNLGSVWERLLIDPTAFYTLASCRAVDTRDPAAPLAGPALVAGATRTFALAGACGIPADAKSLAVNVTAVHPAAAGDLRLFPGDEVAPLASAINFRAGQVRANNANLAVSQDGSASVTVQADMAFGVVDVLLDVVGFYR